MRLSSFATNEDYGLHPFREISGKKAMKKRVTLFIVCFAVPASVYALSAYGHEVLEPGSIALLGIGLLGLGLARFRVRANK